MKHAGDGLAGLEREMHAGSGNRNGEGRTGRHERGSSGFEVRRCWRSGNEWEGGRFDVGMVDWLLLRSVEIASDPAGGVHGVHQQRAWEARESVCRLLPTCTGHGQSAGSITSRVIVPQIIVPFSAISARIVDLTPDSSSTRRGEYARWDERSGSAGWDGWVRRREGWRGCVCCWCVRWTRSTGGQTT